MKATIRRFPVHKPKSIALEIASQAALALVVGLGASLVLAGAALLFAGSSAPEPGATAGAATRQVVP